MTTPDPPHGNPGPERGPSGDRSPLPGPGGDPQPAPDGDPRPGPNEDTQPGPDGVPQPVPDGDTRPGPGRDPRPGLNRDPGLQPERTRLAWRRTTLSSTVAAVLAAKAAVHDGASAPGVLACALCILLWLGFLGVAHRRIRALSGHPGSPPPLTPRLTNTASLCTVALALCATLVVF